MCAENNKTKVTLYDIKQDVESLRHDTNREFESLKENMKEMKQEPRVTGLATLLALALTFIGIGFFFMQYSPSTYMQYYFIVLGIVLGVWAIVRYFPKSKTSDKNKPRGG